jgi:hypothetical protein
MATLGDADANWGSLNAEQQEQVNSMVRACHEGQSWESTDLIFFRMQIPASLPVKNRVELALQIGDALASDRRAHWIGGQFVDSSTYLIAAWPKVSKDKFRAWQQLVMASMRLEALGVNLAKLDQLGANKMLLRMELNAFGERGPMIAALVSERTRLLSMI